MTNVDKLIHKKIDILTDELDLFLIENKYIFNSAHVRGKKYYTILIDELTYKIIISQYGNSLTTRNRINLSHQINYDDFQIQKRTIKELIDYISLVTF